MQQEPIYIPMLESPPEQFASYSEFPPTRMESWRSLEDGQQLGALIYEPRGTANGRTMVFYFGGGWRQGSPWQFAPYAEHLASRGWLVVLPEYRVRDRHGTTPIDAALDARAFMRWIAEHSDRLGVDKDKIFAGGGSAGGQLAASLPITASLDNEGGKVPLPKGLVLFNPAANFDHPEGIGRRRPMGDFGVSLEEFLTVDPHAHATPEYPPTLILHGTADNIVPISAIEDFALRLRQLAVKVHMVAFEGRQHGFFNLNRGISDFEATLAHIDDFLEGMVSG